MSIVYRKTAKGIAEIETRALRLPPRLRSALILVDGKKSDEELAALIAGDAPATLASLRGDGLIEVLATLADRPAQGAPERQPTPPAGSTSDSGPGARPVESLRREAVRSLNDQLGPAGETLVLKIERAKTLAELQPLLGLGVQVLRDFRGRAAAEAFAARFVDES